MKCLRLREPLENGEAARSRSADAGEGLPDIAEAEAILLDLARVFGDSVASPADAPNHFTEKRQERLRISKRQILKPNIARCWSKYRRLSSWHISTEVSAKHM